MAKISTTFDTKEKSLEVYIDDKKIKNVKEVIFYTYNDRGTVEITTVDDKNEEEIMTVTKVLANQNGEAEISKTTENLMTPKIAQALFPRKNIKGV